MRIANRRAPAATAAAALAAIGGLLLPPALAAQESEVPAEVMAAGEALFLVNCRQCHGTRGTAGAPLADNEKLRDAAFVASTIIVGPGYMTAFGDHLDDEQIAAIATYIRNTWGNAYGPVAPDVVAPLR